MPKKGFRQTKVSGGTSRGDKRTGVRSPKARLASIKRRRSK